MSSPRFVQGPRPPLPRRSKLILYSIGRHCWPISALDSARLSAGVIGLDSCCLYWTIGLLALYVSISDSAGYSLYSMPHVSTVSVHTLLHLCIVTAHACVLYVHDVMSHLTPPPSPPPHHDLLLQACMYCSHSNFRSHFARGSAATPRHAALAFMESFDASSALDQNSDPDEVFIIIIIRHRWSIERVLCDVLCCRFGPVSTQDGQEMTQHTNRQLRLTLRGGACSEAVRIIRTTKKTLRKLLCALCTL